MPPITLDAEPGIALTGSAQYDSRLLEPGEPSWALRAQRMPAQQQEVDGATPAHANAEGNGR